MTVRPPGAVRSIAVSQRERMADGLDHHRGLESAFARLIWRVRLVHAHGPRQVQLVGELVDADDRDVVVRQRGDHRGHADAAEPDDDRRSGRAAAVRR